MEKFCTDILIAGGYRNMIQRAVYFSFTMLSIIGLLIVAVTIFQNKKLNQHPSPLIARICIAEAVFAWNAYFKYFYPVIPVCYLQLYKVFHYTTFKWFSFFDSFMILIYGNEVFLHLF